MSRKDIIMMTAEELRRVSVVNQAIEKLIKQKDAAKVIGLSYRQTKRLIARVRKEGDTGVNESLYVGDIAIHSSFSGDGYRLVFPDKMLKNGKRIQCVHPINREATEIFTRAIIRKLKELMEDVRNKSEKEKA